MSDAASLQCTTDATKTSDEETKKRMMRVCTKLNSTKSKKGMPFYIKKSVYSQVTTWQHVDYVVSVSYQFYKASDLKKAISTTNLGKILVPQGSYYGSSMNTVLAEVAKIGELEPIECKSGESCKEMYEKLKPLADAYSTLRTKMRTVAAASNSTVPSDATLVGNKVIQEMVVDTSTTYYINGRRPIIGSGKVNFELASDQTLTKVESEADSKTLETLTGLLPVKEFFTEQWGLAPDEAEEEPDPEAEKPPPAYMVKVVFAADSKVTVYTLKKVGLTDVERVTIKPIEKSKADTGEVELTVGNASASADKKKPKKGYTVEGKIILPE